MDIINKEFPRACGFMRLSTYQWRDEYSQMYDSDILGALYTHTPDDTAENHNVMCYSGLSQMVSAINWAAIQDQNNNMGSPFSTTYMTPMYGAVGTGSPSPSFADVKLQTEYARNVVSSAGITNGTSGFNPSVIWLFLLSPPAVQQTITEAGVFLVASSTVNSGLMLDHSVFTGITWSTTQLLTLSLTLSLGN